LLRLWRMRSSSFLRSRRPAIAMWLAILAVVFGGSALRAIHRPGATAALPGCQDDVDRGGGEIGAHRQRDRCPLPAAS
jgi:hypothetical protein